MDPVASRSVFVLGNYRLDPAGGGLFRESEYGLVPVVLGSRALDILALLVSRRGDLVTKEQIFAAVWPNMTIEESNLTVQIAAVRRVLDDGRVVGSCIQTVSGHGYRFVADVMNVPYHLIEDGPPSGPTECTRLPTDHGFTRWQHLLGSIPAPSVIGDRRVNRVPAPHLSLIVLPFASFSRRADQQFFADQMTEELTTALSRFNGMRVASRTTAFAYRHKRVDAGQIRRDLNIRYLLEGSVQCFSDRVRVTAHLIDAQADAHVWAQRFDHDATDPLASQDATTTRLAVAVYQALVSAEAAQPTDDPDAGDYILRARAAFQLGRDGSAEAISLLECALALDPHSPEAQAWLAEALAFRTVEGIAKMPAAEIARAKGLAAQALAASPRSAFAHSVQGRVLCAQGRFEEATPEFETAIAIHPNWPHLYGYLSDCKLWTGSIDAAIPLIERAIAISPGDPCRASWYFSIGRVNLLQSCVNEAVLCLEKARTFNPHHPQIHAWLAAACGINGEIERGRAELAEGRGLNCDGRYSSISRLKDAEFFGVPEVRKTIEDTYLTGLRRAGVQED